MLGELDEKAFEFVECDTVDAAGNKIEPYWLMGVTRIIDDFDEERSDFVRYADMAPGDPDSLSNPTIARLNDIYMSADMSEEYHAFWLSRHPLYFIFDDTIVDRWRSGIFVGAQFTPLQPPIGNEITEHHYFLNLPYWTSKMEVDT